LPRFRRSDHQSAHDKTTFSANPIDGQASRSVSFYEQQMTGGFGVDFGGSIATPQWPLPALS
jgi:hypothetical protein